MRGLEFEQKDVKEVRETEERVGGQNRKSRESSIKRWREKLIGQ